MERRVVITSVGVVSPVGNDVDSFWDGLKSGKSGIDRIQSFDASAYATQIAGEVKSIDFTKFVDAKEARRTDRGILLAIAASNEAMAKSGINLEEVNLDRFGTVIGTGVGGISTLEKEHEKLLKRGPNRVSPFLIPMMILDMTSGMVSIQYGLKGPNYSLVSACASSGHAIGDAFISIKAGMMDIALTGGTEAPVSPIGMAGFCSMKAMSTNNDNPQAASCPFDSKRDGFVMGEGSGIIILEELEHALSRNANILAEIVGYGATGDAHHLSAPAPNGEGAQRAMKMALDMGNLSVEDVDYINAHGTSTPLNDKYESQAIMAVFGDYAEKVSISSTKSMTGHLLGASGSVELIASVLAIRDGIIPPTINYQDPDPECPLNYTPNKAVKKDINVAISNSFGFGGHNACLAIKKYESVSSNS